MSDSPINFMMYGHTPSFLQSLELKNKLLSEKLSDLVAQLTSRKQQNLKHLKEIDNQQETIKKLEKEIEDQSKRREVLNFNSMSFSKSIQDRSDTQQHSIQHIYRFLSKSTEIPNKKAYLDVNNKSIESSIDAKLCEKKLSVQIKQVKPKINSYGNLYNKKSFSLNKFKLK